MQTTAKQMIKVLPMLVLATGFTGCVEARRLVMKFVSFEEEGRSDAGKSLEPSFTGKDETRTKLKVRLTLVSAGMPMPTDIQALPGDRSTVVVLTKTGTAYAVDTSSGTHKSVFTLPVRAEAEEGLLGLAFHPRFEDNRKFYLNYTPAEEQATVVAEWLWPRSGKPRATKVILKVGQPYQNHNGGQLAFGPDGYLYVGFGDGGWADDPHGNGQNPATLLGSMLRLDVDRSDDGLAYAVPDDNPFRRRHQARPEVWAIGLRNPWRYSFAPDGRLIVADVGQYAAEELNLVRAGDNLGWDTMEGRRCHEPEEGCSREGLKLPFLTYGRGDGASITGGYVVTGDSVPELKGKYVFGDFTSGRMWAVTLPPDDSQALTAESMEALGAFGLNLSTFGLDARGDLLVGSFDAGAVYRVTTR